MTMVQSFIGHPVFLYCSFFMSLRLDALFLLLFSLLILLFMALSVERSGRKEV